MQQISATPTSKGCFFLPSEADEVSSVLESCSDTPSHNPPFKYFHSYNILSHSYEKTLTIVFRSVPSFRARSANLCFSWFLLLSVESGPYISTPYSGTNSYELWTRFTPFYNIYVLALARELNGFRAMRYKQNRPEHFGMSLWPLVQHWKKSPLKTFAGRSHILTYTCLFGFGHKQCFISTVI